MVIDGINVAWNKKANFLLAQMASRAANFQGFIDRIRYLITQVQMWINSTGVKWVITGFTPVYPYNVSCTSISIVHRCLNMITKLIIHQQS